ncbi:transcriptional regulator [Phyllobacterium myrsinacearum]|uniref:Transcriptional regulator n=1 Tax=Phyllobacterium myrsinacearum TaxID=28101 RepID=A0A2S9JHQ1_9HYPH|nr:transcriptional regulator [Phyllobacterium myrsinacearum]PRD52500.1 transcriptional regulator [Phyllobacterium myrsinacearum]
MKKVTRGFAIEYKSRRRKSEPKSNAIWGNLDLKTVIQDLQNEAMPLLQTDAQDSNLDDDLFLSEEQAGSLLTPPVGQPTTAQDLQETKMTDEENTTLDVGAPAAAGADIPKKPRKPRAKKVIGETLSGEVATALADGKQKRGRKPKSDQGGSHAKQVRRKRASNAVQTATASSTNEIADLQKLDEENQRLRKLLADKLRAENADLRKRLNLG